MFLLLLLLLLLLLMRRGRVDGLRGSAIKSASQHDVAMLDGDAGGTGGGIGEEAEDDRFPWPADLIGRNQSGILESRQDVSNVNIEASDECEMAGDEEAMERGRSIE